MLKGMQYSLDNPNITMVMVHETNENNGNTAIKLCWYIKNVHLRRSSRLHHWYSFLCSLERYNIARLQQVSSSFCSVGHRQIMAHGSIAALKTNK